MNRVAQAAPNNGLSIGPETPSMASKRVGAPAELREYLVSFMDVGTILFELYSQLRRVPRPTFEAHG